MNCYDIRLGQLCEVSFSLPIQAENEFVAGTPEWAPDDEISRETKMKVSVHAVWAANNSLSGKNEQ